MGFFETLFAIFKPSNTVFIVAVLGLLLVVIGRRRLGLPVLAVAIASWGAIAFLPLGVALLHPLEARFKPAVPDHVDSIVLLGGFMDRAHPDPLQIQLGRAGERLVATAILARRFPDAQVVITDIYEATSAAGVLAALGVAPDRIVIETRAQSTWDNAIFTADLIHPEPDRTYALVTSAAHMPRAMGVFRRAGWPPMVPVPVDFRAPKSRWAMWSNVPGNAADGFADFDWAVREWLALFDYWITGRTDALIPSPAPRPAPAGGGAPLGPSRAPAPSDQMTSVENRP